jgi:hypothetical protein
MAFKNEINEFDFSRIGDNGCSGNFRIKSKNDGNFGKGIINGFFF